MLPASSARSPPVTEDPGPADPVSAIAVTGSSVPGDPVTATLTSPVRPSPGFPSVIPNGCGVLTSAPMTRTRAVTPSSAASVASTVTRTTCRARPALSVNRSVDSMVVIRMTFMSHEPGSRQAPAAKPSHGNC